MMEKKITKEMLEKVRQAKSVEELLALTKENGVEITPEQAAELFDKLNSGAELTDEEIGKIAGGIIWRVADSDALLEDIEDGKAKSRFI